MLRAGFSEIAVVLVICILTLGSAENAIAWESEVPVCTEEGDQNWRPNVVEDGLGGGIVAWTDGRPGANGKDIYAQRVDGNGAVQWDVNGIAVCTDDGDQHHLRSISDMNGGAIMVWSDSTGIHAQKVDGNGNLLWGNGVAICLGPKDETFFGVAGDGAGGAIVAWTDYRSGRKNPDIYAQKLASDGSPVWDAGGVPVCTASREQEVSGMGVAGDGSGGVVIVWRDKRDRNWDVYAQRLNASGEPQWADDGVPIATGSGDQGPRGGSGDTSDGTPGVVCSQGIAIVAWMVGTTNFDVYAKGIDIDTVELLWGMLASDPGVPVSEASGSQWAQGMVSDGSGGAITCWDDSRDFGTTDGDVYIQRVYANGSLWQADGIPVCNLPESQRGHRSLTSDGAGGAMIVWRDMRDGNADVYAQWVDADGNLQWNTNGVAVATGPAGQSWPTLAPDGDGGAIVVWRLNNETSTTGRGKKPRPQSHYDVYAQRVYSTGLFTLAPQASAGQEDNGYQLLQNYRNPFNPDTWIPFKLGETQHVVIKIHNAAGKLIRTLDLGRKAPGAYIDKDRAAYWDGRNENDDQVASGVYFYTIEAGGFTSTKKMVLAK